MGRGGVCVTGSHPAWSCRVIVTSVAEKVHWQRRCEAKNWEAGGLKTNGDRLQTRDELCCMVEYSCCPPIYSQELRLHIYTWRSARTSAAVGISIFPHRLSRVALSFLFRLNLRATPYRCLASFLNVPSQAKLTCIAGVPSCAKTDVPSLIFSFSAALLC